MEEAMPPLAQGRRRRHAGGPEREPLRARGGSQRYRFAGAFDVVEYGEEDRISVGDLALTFRRTSHPKPCYAPRLTDGRATVVYSADAGYAPDLVSHAKGADIFLCEATFAEADPALTKRYGHMTGEQAGRLAAEAGVDRLVLTHLGPDSKEHAINIERARERFGGAVDLARTGQVFYV